jgi:hypothetical protein
MEAFFMSDYRNPNDPLRRDLNADPDSRAMNATWGWIAAAVFIVVVLAVAFGIGHQPGTVNGNNVASNAPASQMAPPPVAPGPTATTPPSPIAPAPNTPADRNP